MEGEEGGEGRGSTLLFAERDKLRVRLKKDGEEIEGDFEGIVASVLVRVCLLSLTVEVGVEGEETGSFVRGGETTAEDRFLRREGDFGGTSGGDDSCNSRDFPFFEVLLISRLLLDITDLADGAGLGARFPPPPTAPGGSVDEDREIIFEID
jgi:hypothetical protein